MQTRSDKHHAILSAELTSDLRKDGKSAGLGFVRKIECPDENSSLSFSCF